MRAPEQDGKTPRVTVHRGETVWRGMSRYCERNYPPSRLGRMRVQRESGASGAWAACARRSRCEPRRLGYVGNPQTAPRAAPAA